MDKPSEDYRYCWRAMPGGWAMSPTSMQSCPLGRVRGRHPGLGLLPILGWSIWKVKVAGPALGPSFTTNSRGVPQPLPCCHTPPRRERKTGGGQGSGRKACLHHVAVRAAVVGLIHPGLPRKVRASAPPSSAHIATTHPCFLGSCNT